MEKINELNKEKHVIEQEINKKEQEINKKVQELKKIHLMNINKK